MKSIFTAEQRRSYLYLTHWVLIAVLAGIIGVLLLQGFRSLVSLGQNLLLLTSVPLPLWGVLAAILVGGIIYRIEPDAAGEGMPSYLECLNLNDGDFPLGATLWKLPSAVLTLVSFGSGGVAGPVGRVSAGIMSAITGLFGKLYSGRDDSRTAAVCGMAAVIGALFHAPIGGGIFAVEIIQKANMRYSDLFPSIIASAIAVWISQQCGWTPLLSVTAPRGSMSVTTFGTVLLLSLALGLLGGFYTGIYSRAVRVFRRDRGNVVIKVVIGMGVTSAAVWLINPSLMGTASAVFRAVFEDEQEVILGALPNIVPIGAAAIIMMLVRVFASCATIGSGMSAGLMGPSAMVGLLAAYSVNHFLGIPAGTPEYYGILAAGFSGILASSMNVPVAATIMTIELFGPNYAIAAGFAAVIGFQVNRHHTIYDFALAGSGSHS